MGPPLSSCQKPRFAGESIVTGAGGDNGTASGDEGCGGIGVVCPAAVTAACASDDDAGGATSPCATSG